MEKLIVHKIKILGKSKLQFQILLPENAEAITGIAATCDRAQISSGGGATNHRFAGHLRLFMADAADKFFSQPLYAVSNPPLWQTIGDKNFSVGLWGWRKPFELLDTYQPAENLLIDGFYQDTAGYGVETMEYNVRVYLRLKMKAP